MEKIPQASRLPKASPEEREIISVLYKRTKIKRDENGSDEAQLFPNDREDKVSMIFREEIQLALRAFEKALPDETAAADGNLRLDDMVTGAIRIDVRIEKDEDTHLLVAVQHEEPDEREDYDERKKSAFHELHLEPGNIKHAEGDGREDKARTKVRLDEDQKCRKCHHTRDRQKALPCLEAGSVIRHEPCQTDDHDDFRKFGRLQRERADLDPALRPKRTRSGEFDDQKQDRIDAIEYGDEAIEFPVVKIERAPGDDKTADKEVPCSMTKSYCPGCPSIFA
mgnify:CR=1 FL=1